MQRRLNIGNVDDFFRGDDEEEIRDEDDAYLNLAADI